jgi:hypothetical protein
VQNGSTVQVIVRPTMPMDPPNSSVIVDNWNLPR